MAQQALTNGVGQTVQPSETLYCSNLPDKLPKDDLKRALYMLFITYGPILDIVALKTAKMRGQAHVLFRDKYSSTQAMRALQDFEFFGKPMKVAYAKSKSDTLAKLDGTYKQPQPSLSATSPAPAIAPTSVVAAPPATNGTPVATQTGSKRPREESDDEQGEDDAAMDMDESDDD